MLRDYLDLFCIAYLDDILIYSQNANTHTQDVRKVLEHLLKHRLFVKLEKCVFSVSEISFLGFILTTEDVKIDLSRVPTIEEWPVPKCFQDIQVFLRFANFYRRFIQEFSRIVRGLSGMLKGSSKGKFQGMNFILTKDAEITFHQICSAFTTEPMLRHFDPLLFLRMETDASGFAILGTLSKRHPETGHWHPVAFSSRKKIPAEMNHGIGVSEMLAIVEECKK